MTGKKMYVQFMGGLGNQMFQYAFLKECQFRGMNIAADITWYERTKLNAVFELDKVFPNIALPIGKKKGIYLAMIPFYWKKIWKILWKKKSLPFEEKEDSRYEEEIFSVPSGILQGYWQSEKYFQNVKEEIRKSFQFQCEDKGIQNILSEIKKEKHSVAVHIRRGDYMNADNLYGNICTQAYYEKAIKQIKEVYPDAVFYFFSNDLAWVKENYQGECYRYPDLSQCEHYENWYDMYLMSQCENNIIANSTFSWWAAWLNPNPKKIVLTPSKWLNGKETPDIWCDGWKKVI